MAKQAQLDAVRPVLDHLDSGADLIEKALNNVDKGADKATEVIEAGLETVADVVPEALDKGVHATTAVAKRGARAFRNPKTLAIIIALSGAAAGVAVGITAYKIQRKRLQKEFEASLERQLDEMRQFYMLRNKEGEFLTPRSAAEKLLVNEAVDVLETYEGTQDGTAVPAQSPAETPAGTNGQVRYDQVIRDSDAAAEIRQAAITVTESVNPVKHNIFVDGKELVPDDWNQEGEEAHRQPEVPYVISYEEFMENAFEHEQRSVTWYDADDTLADAADGIINDLEATVGTDNMNRFGHGSKDGNVVYIRNERLEIDFEVTRNLGSFAEIVMNLSHSDDTRFRRVPRRGGDRE